MTERRINSSFPELSHVKKHDVIVHKFGGTSVEATPRVVDIVDRVRQIGGRHIVVVSALRGVTNKLVEIGETAGHMDSRSALRIAEDVIVRRHVQHAEAIGLSQKAQHRFAEEELGDSAVELLTEMLKGRRANADTLLAAGEATSSRLVAVSLEDHGIPSKAVDARSFLQTTEHVGSTPPQVIWKPTIENGQRVLNNLLDQGITPVVTGFIGKTHDGRTTTLGRGGSDLTGAIASRIMGADLYTIWTDVDGVYDKDPRKHTDARMLYVLTRNTADEMAQAGSKVLYPGTMVPLESIEYPPLEMLPTVVYVRNTFNLKSPGTYIARNYTPRRR